MRIRVPSAWLALSIVFCLCAPPTLAAPPPDAPERLELVDHVGKDPMLVVVTRSDDLLEPIRKIADTLAKMDSEYSGDAVENALNEMEEELGFPLREDLLAQIGPEFGFVLTLPALDDILASTESLPVAIPTILDGTGFLAQVRDRDRVDRSLRKLLKFDAEEAEIVEGDDGLVRIRFPAPVQTSSEEETIDLCYGIRNGWLVVGLNPDWVLDSLVDAAPGTGLANGEDFKKVFSHLDPNATTLSYLNLPALLAWAKESRTLAPILDQMSESEPETGALVDLFLSEEYMGVGLGYTVVETDGGAKTSSFGPAALTGPGMYAAMIAAVAAPNLVNATDRGKQKRTMADIRSIATSMEAFAIDNNRYPGPTDGWHPVAKLRSDLQPIYIRELPVVDGWGHLLRVISDGKSYTIVSPGKDGELDGDWSGPIEPRSTTAFEADIVFRDGAFVSWPEGKQE